MSFSSFLLSRYHPRVDLTVVCGHRHPAGLDLNRYGVRPEGTMMRMILRHQETALQRREQLETLEHNARLQR